MIRARACIALIVLAACKDRSEPATQTREPARASAASTNARASDTVRYRLVVQNDEPLPHFFPPDVSERADTVSCGEMLFGGRFALVGGRWSYADSSRITCPAKLKAMESTSPRATGRVTRRAELGTDSLEFDNDHGAPIWVGSQLGDTLFVSVEGTARRYLRIP